MMGLSVELTEVDRSDTDRHMQMLVEACRSIYQPMENAEGRNNDDDQHRQLRSISSDLLHGHWRQAELFDNECQRWPDLKVGEVLRRFYARGLLEEPLIDDLRGHRLNAAEVVSAFWPLRFFIADVEWVNHFHSTSIYPGARHAQEILGMRVSDLLQIPGKKARLAMAKAPGHQFSTNVLHISWLQRIGLIDIEWTNFLWEHLELSLSPSPRLKLYWFAWATFEVPVAR
jgi:hypothetical protein